MDTNRVGVFLSLMLGFPEEARENSGLAVTWIARRLGIPFSRDRTVRELMYISSRE